MPPPPYGQPVSVELLNWRMFMSLVYEFETICVLNGHIGANALAERNWLSRVLLMNFQMILASTIHYCRLMMTAGLGGFGIFFLAGGDGDASIVTLGLVNLSLAVAIFVFDSMEKTARRSMPGRTRRRRRYADG